MVIERMKADFIYLPRETLNGPPARVVSIGR